MKNLLSGFLTIGALLVVFGILNPVGVTLGASSTPGVLTPDNTYMNPQDDGNVIAVNVIGNDKGQQDAFVNVVKGAVNRVLGILALIALLILLYGGFQMVTSAGDEDKYGAGFTILKHAATGLLLIGIAWFVISIIFWLVNVVATPSANSTAGTNG